MITIKQILIMCFITLFSIDLLAQTEKKDATLAGVYLTSTDFKKDKLTYDIDCSTEKQKIKLHDFLSKSYIDVYYKGEKHTLQKKDVYGYKDCHGNTFRFFGNEEYQLAESGNINIYFQQSPLAVDKGFTTINEYYFSSTLNNEIKSLNIENLKYAFPDNHKFHDALEVSFKGKDISEYDTFHKMYKVNHIYQMSLN